MRIWSLVCISKEDSCPSVLKTITLKASSPPYQGGGFFHGKEDILKATELLREDIINELVDRNWNLDDDSEKYIKPEELLSELNLFNSKSLSFYVIRVFPPSQENFQQYYKL